MGLGGILLSSIAGAMIGSWIGGKLFNNPTYQNQRATNYSAHKHTLVVQPVLINLCPHQVRVVQPKVVVILAQAREVVVRHQVEPVVQVLQPVQEVKYVAYRKS